MGRPCYSVQWSLKFLRGYYKYENPTRVYTCARYSRSTQYQADCFHYVMPTFRMFISKNVRDALCCLHMTSRADVRKSVCQRILCAADEKLMRDARCNWRGSAWSNAILFLMKLQRHRDWYSIYPRDQTQPFFAICFSFFSESFILHPERERERERERESCSERCAYLAYEIYHEKQASTLQIYINSFRYFYMISLCFIWAFDFTICVSIEKSPMLTEDDPS